MYKLLIPIFLILGSCVSILHVSKEENSNSSFYPLIMTNIDSKIIDTTYIITGQTTAIPPSIFKKFDKYIYLIEFKIAVEMNLTWNQPFLINVQFLDGKSEIFTFNDEKMTLDHITFYDYSFTVAGTNTQKLDICLGYQDETGSYKFDFGNPFKCKTIKLR